jgi:hypothetical protein
MAVRENILKVSAQSCITSGRDAMGVRVGGSTVRAKLGGELPVLAKFGHPLLLRYYGSLVGRR